MIPMIPKEAAPNLSDKPCLEVPWRLGLWEGWRRTARSGERDAGWSRRGALGCDCSSIRKRIATSTRTRGGWLLLGAIHSENRQGSRTALPPAPSYQDTAIRLVGVSTGNHVMPTAVIRIRLSRYISGQACHAYQGDPDTCLREVFSRPTGIMVGLNTDHGAGRKLRRTTRQEGLLLLLPLCCCCCCCCPCAAAAGVIAAASGNAAAACCRCCWPMSTTCGGEMKGLRFACGVPKRSRRRAGTPLPESYQRLRTMSCPQQHRSQ
mmetsp:Transcript_52429/g.106905  ORF Transcript_52429/g.106905 Transcript_52429/m.106905 type:complete len:264 (-) Transcript_52429:682-1473(-)